MRLLLRAHSVRNVNATSSFLSLRKVNNMHGMTRSKNIRRHFGVTLFRACAPKCTPACNNSVIVGNVPILIILAPIPMPDIPPTAHRCRFFLVWNISYDSFGGNNHRGNTTGILQSTRVTLVGSIIPFATNLRTCVSALYPKLPLSFFTSSTTTAPSFPALLAIWHKGVSNALRKISIPIFSSPFTATVSKIGKERKSATPPPRHNTFFYGCAGGSHCVFYALLFLLHFSFCSSTYFNHRHTPVSFAKRSWSFSLSNELSVLLSCVRNCATRSAITLHPFTAYNGGSIFGGNYFVGMPQIFQGCGVEFNPTSSGNHTPTGDRGNIVQHFFTPVAKARSTHGKRRRKAPRNLLTTKVAKASPSISSAISRFLFAPLYQFSNKGKISASAPIFYR